MVESPAGTAADGGGTAAVVEELALALEGTGLSRMAGRVVGLLLLAGGPQSLDSLASSVRASKASMSTTARQLARLGLLEQVAVPGERRDHYRLRSGSWAVLLEDKADALARLGAVARRTSNARPTPPAPDAAADLDDLVRFCDMAAGELAALMARYRRM